MLKINLLTLVLQGYPECVALVCLTYSLSKMEWQWKRILLVALTYWCCVLILRSLPISFGVHGVILIVSLHIWLTLLAKIQQLTALKASLIGFVTLVLVESLIFALIVKITGLDFEFIVNTPKLRLICGYPQVLVIFLLAVLIKKRNEKLGAGKIKKLG
ncbi:MAG TPA: hypothetical protein GXX38_09550 [Clostridia bacterium]|nr:hypothetical protein [Clostridia bacterium]